MKLYQKTLLAVGVTILTLVVMLSIFWRGILLDSYAGFERVDTARDVERGTNAFGEQVAQIATHLSDWAAWDAAWRYMVDQEPGFLPDNIAGPIVFNDLHIHVMALVAPDGHLKLARAINHDEQPARWLPFPPSVLAKLGPTSPIRQLKGPYALASGVLMLPEGPMLVSARTITNSLHTAETRGVMVWGRYLTPGMIDKLGELTHLRLAVHSVADPALPADERQAVAHLLAPSAKGPLVEPLDDQNVAGYALIKDLDDRPALLLRVDTRRNVYLQGQETVKNSLAILVLCGLLFGLLNVVMLKRIVLGRLARLSEDVGRIGQSGALSARVEAAGNDELSSLAGAVNGMLGQLEASQAAVVALETQRAQEELTRMGKEMEIATRISTALVPRETLAVDFSLSMDLVTAAEVGGDLIDYLPQAEGRFWLAIGDVTGHGLTPGLVMMMAQSMLTGYIVDNPLASPSQHLVRLNQVLYQNVKHRLKNDNYMTLQLIRYDGDGRFVAAGMHCDLLIYRAATKHVERVEVPGFWTGLLPDVREMTHDHHFELGPDDILMLYSDGLIEAMNAHDEQFDMDRLEQALLRDAELPVEEIQARLLAEVRAWLVNQLDDISIIVLKRHGVGVASHAEAIASAG